MMRVEFGDLVVADGEAYLVSAPSPGDTCEGCGDLASLALRPLSHSRVPVATVAYCKYDLVNALQDPTTPDRLYRPADSRNNLS